MDRVDSIVDSASSLRMELEPEGQPPTLLPLLCPRTPLSSIMAGRTQDGACRHQQQSSLFKIGQAPEVSRIYKYCVFQHN